jgi:hypothetical protein
MDKSQIVFSKIDASKYTTPHSLQCDSGIF